MTPITVGVDPGLDLDRLAARFWPRVDQSDASGCWPWTGPLDDGYGRLRKGRRDQGIFRPAQASFLLTHGWLPPAVCHHCDNPPCCNPAHLFAGTLAINNRDMWAKGRGKIPHPRGDGQAFHKLTEAQVLDIRERLVQGQSLNTLAAAFGVSKRLIGMIRDREKWAWL